MATSFPNGQNLQAQNQNAGTNNSRRTPFLLVAVGLGLILVVLVLISVFLFLNRQGENVLPATPAVSVPRSERITFPFIGCGVVKEQCAAGQAIVEEASGATIYAVRFSNLANGSQVFASIAGEKTVLTPNSFLITNTERVIELRYVIEGGSVFGDESASSYNEGEPIGTFAGEENTLTLYAKSINSQQSIHLGIGEGGEYLTNLE